MSNVELRVVSSAQTGILHRTSSGSQKKLEMYKDRIMTYSTGNNTLTRWLMHNL